MLLRSLIIALFLLGFFRCTVALAQGPAQAVVLVSADEHAPPGRVRAFATHIERAARMAGYGVMREPVGWAEGRVSELGTLSVDRVDAFRRVERLIIAARANTAGLMESRALAELHRAATLTRSLADVPGAAAWIAEVQTTLGITAAQAGLPDLAEDAFARAATLDPSRGVRAAEAPPAVVERAAGILAAVARRPRGSFEVRATSAGARVFLDDREVGLAPRIVRAPVGTHVLRVEAPGMTPWGSVLDVLEGRRPPVVVELAPDRLVASARRLVAASARFDPVDALHQGASLGVDAVWLARVGAGPEDRALLIRCTNGGCDEPQRLALDEVPFVLSAATPRPWEAVRVGQGTGAIWLDGRAVQPPPPEVVPFYRRWYVWAGLAVLAGGAAAAIAAAAQPDAQQVYEVEVVPGAVLGSGSP